MKIQQFEKTLIKGLIQMNQTNDCPLNTSEIENELRRITGNNNMDHRYDVEAYTQDLISKITFK